MSGLVLRIALAIAQAVPPVEPPSARTTAVENVDGRHLQAGTSVLIQVDADISSATATVGQSFPVSLVDEVRIGAAVVPAGLSGAGEVVHAARSGGGGRAGELILAARYLDCGVSRIPLGKFRVNQAGTNRAGAVLAASGVVSVFALFIKGGNVIVPRGTRGAATVTADVLLPPGGCAAAAGSMMQQSTDKQEGK